MGLGDIVQKAMYLGVGLASLAGEKATEKLTELRSQAQKLADEMVARGEISTEEARRFVDDMVSKAQNPSVPSSPPNTSTEPRKIEILDEDEPEAEDAKNVDEMRRRLEELQEELKRLKTD
jgi:polyhydroxyalkanoate synthesis regulator phasin